ncbi:MAG: lysophospholipid acyltransferase family protein [Alphaproteobacteria bacterium]
MARLKDILRKPLAQRAACALIAGYIRLVRATSRLSVVGGEHPQRLWDADAPFILAFWHGRLLMMPYSWPRPRPMRVLISRHSDGRLISGTLARFGIDNIAGSSSRGGAAALMAIVKSLTRERVSVAISPDGPRGPRMRASLGAIQAARLSGAPILPCMFAASRRKVLGSWDRFILALPFARAVFVWGEPLYIPRDIADDQLETLRAELEARMNALADQADRLCGVAPIVPAPIVSAEMPA